MARKRATSSFQGRTPNDDGDLSAKSPSTPKEPINIDNILDGMSGVDKARVSADKTTPDSWTNRTPSYSKGGYVRSVGTYSKIAKRTKRRG
jgi:hypothetical protein